MYFLKITRSYVNDDPMCKDVTLGNCPIDDDRVIQEIDGIPAEDCQAACLKYTNCIIYRFSTQTDSEPSHCQLLTYDYRQACKTTAAPIVSNQNLCFYLMEQLKLPINFSGKKR